ncbi:ABC transporter ATP-binding protein [Pseudogemmatithrix spongiicola]|uniref:ABC transporter ATP-binding protein n=1 Tax=Pseudogemmatithrix spongiicola TaxID=3062599 RepID=A0AA49Q5F6_9BACT|nr:ABC transporter ATP-binding protein [Gemmatimonadaceae bacterium 'strain 138']WKW15566.1 ABC transporter ATP-binding protein [Gemmatimonadaceae bacterium 'strain 318']
MTDAIRIRDLHWKAGREFAIRDLSMRVPTGAIYGFLGPNGSGKTSTIRCLLGMQPPHGGSIEVLGHAMPAKAPAALARIGYVPERLHLYGRLTVEESIRFHATFFPTFDHAEAERLRKRFTLRETQRIAALSKGEAGKLMMLLALAQRPELLVLDEPTDGLDPVIRRDVLSALVEFVEAKQATVLISSHLVHEQERICDWVGVMDGGRLVAELPMQEFRSGIKRLRVSGDAVSTAPFPCTLLSKGASGPHVDTWVVRGWQPEMREWFARAGAELREVEDLDLEESFVELLSGARAATMEAR